jgi:two-component system sensor histidine kinase TctE
VNRRSLSLRQQLLRSLMLPLGILWVISGATAFFIAENYAELAYDRALSGAVDALIERLHINAKGVDLKMPEAVLEFLAYDSSDRVFYQVQSPEGNVIAGNAALPPPPKERVSGRMVFYDGAVDGETVRVAAKTRHLGTAEQPHLVLVQVAETLGKRHVLARQIVTGLVVPGVVLIALVFALVWFGISQAIAPLDRLASAIRARSFRDLSPVSESYAPREVRPLLASINELLQMLEGVLSAQQRFIADAAHQMRTPLAGLKTQTELALREHDPAARDHALRQIQASVERTARLVEQLLSLARSEAQAKQGAAPEPADLVELVRAATAGLVPLAVRKNIQFEFEPADEHVTIRCLPMLLRELVINIVDNAIRYTPENGRVTVRVAAHPVPQLAVEDTGPGIPEPERQRVFERFYRVIENAGDGSGLGLAIVREIAAVHGAHVWISAGADGKGTTMHVEFVTSGG